jgi:polyribonucleotide nucleotidyltransferase
MKFQLELGGKKIKIEITDLAEQANGSAFVSLGQTMVLATATMSKKEPEGIDFFPLTVDYEEKYYAAGKILGSRYIRREGRPSEEAILNARVIDRAIRPLFLEDFFREVQVIVTCLSWDEENDPDVAGLLAASLALSLSDIPWQGPIAALRIAKVNGDFVLNPTYREREEREFELALCGIKKGDDILINMIEGQANEANEGEILEAIKKAKPYLKKIIAIQEEIRRKIGKEKIKLERKENKKLEKEIRDRFEKILEKILIQGPSTQQKEALMRTREEISVFVEEKFGQEKINEGKKITEKILKEILRRSILEKERRPDGRKLDQIRELKAEVGILPRTHGSGLFIRGKTKSLSILTLGSPGDQKLLEGMEIRGKKRFMHHYNFPPYCSGEIKPIRGPGRREIGHGMLGEKALFSLIPNFEDFPYTIRVVSEILSSNGSTSMASVSSASLALMDGGVPIKKPAAGIAIGLVSEGENYKLLTDIQGPEDHFGDMDFKVAGTRKGITAIQMDVKIEGITEKIIEEALKRAKKARIQILDFTDKILDKPRERVSPYAPKIMKIKIDPEKIREVIGPGGKTINEIIEKCEVAIDIEPDGLIFVTSDSEKAAKKAIAWINNIAREIKVGEVFQGKVKRILDFGAFVEILPEREGLIHISHLAPFRVKRVEDVVKVGEIVPVKVISIDDQGRINLSLLRQEKRRKYAKRY